MISMNKTKCEDFNLFDDDDDNKNQLDVYNLVDKKLLAQRVIHLNSVMDEGLMNTIMMKIQLLAKRSDEPITIYINTPGGTVYYGLALYDVCKSVRAPIRVVGQGIVASMGAFAIICCGEKGERYAHKNTTFMVHQVSTTSMGKLNDVEVDYEETKRIEQLTEGLMSRHSKLTKKQIKELVKKDHYFNAETALKYGFIDKII